MKKLYVIPIISMVSFLLSAAEPQSSLVELTQAHANTKTCEDISKTKYDPVVTSQPVSAPQDPLRLRGGSLDDESLSVAQECRQMCSNLCKMVCWGCCCGCCCQTPCNKPCEGFDK